MHSTKMNGISKQKKIPPDGGWGWTIVLASAISNILTLSIITNFGIIFRDKLQTVGIQPHDVPMIINIFSAISMFTGLISGPLLQRFSYRKIALVAGSLFSFGIMLTACATRFLHFIIAYSIITALGNGLATASFSLAMYTYFQKKRSRAASIAMTLSGLGPIFYPLLITALLNYFDVTECVLLLGALSLHIIVAGLLLQPIKWHQLVAVNTSDEERLPGEELPFSNDQPYNNNSDNSNISETKVSELNGKHFEKVSNQSLEESQSDCDNKFKQLQASDGPTKLAGNCCKSTKLWLVRFFHLNILKDKIFVNIILGMGIAACAEINFSIFMPFILSELNYTTLQIATFNSTLATVDIVARFLSPYIEDLSKLSPRIIYMLSLVLLILIRSYIFAINSFRGMIALAVALGLAKGIRTVYMTLVIPGHVSIEQLPSAMGMRMSSSGLMLLICGPIFGLLRNFTGNYTICILFFNLLTLISLIMWTVELIWIRVRRKRRREVYLHN